ncbi:uncharacterized protein N7515_010377 [Penicillium bovifimosum]|uniref:CCHC-type domain-containing protein n=1 Tax=Penicillium bovifimosum TaxID=126998 RepID=A0A9W9KTJ2_9EURO|nr:uncharacterized protein N7515_010377 [Penicillium bovifimosum]KAJ5118154.1 hypothetical protein N7515_010377 [Penicillium bovifimosum]
METRSQSQKRATARPEESTHDEDQYTPVRQARDEPLPSLRSTPAISPAPQQSQTRLYLRNQDGKMIIIKDGETLLKWVQTEPTKALEYFAESQESRDYLREKNRKSVERIQELEEYVEELEKAPPSEETERVYHENNTLRKEVDFLRSRLYDARHAPTNTPDTHTSSSAGIQRSAKLPNATIMDDGESVKFVPWRREIENKLLLNADHYPTEKHRMAYVANRCAGKAQAQLQPRLEPDAKDQYRTAEEMLDHLQLVFRDPQQRRIALREYGELKMKANENFNMFYAEFSRLALESKRDEELQKDDLFEKIPYRLQMLVAGDVYKEEVSMQDFVDACRRGAITITRLQPPPSNRFKKSESGGSHQTSSEDSTTSNARASTSSSRTMAANRGRTNTTYEERQALLKEGKCFNCREEGHLSRDCPKREKEDKNKRKEAKTAAVSSRGQHKSTEQRIKDAETDSASDSGKD